MRCLPDGATFNFVASPIEHKGTLGLGDRLVGRRDDGDPIIRLEIYGILILSFAVALLLALLTFTASDVHAGAASRGGGTANLIGPIGAHIADLFLDVVGLGAFFFTGVIGWLGLSYVIGRRAELGRPDVFGWMGLLLGSAVLLHVLFAPNRVLDHLPGGLTGEYVGEILRAFLSTTGTVMVALVTIMVATIALTRRSVFELAIIAWQGLVRSTLQLRDVMTMGEEDDDARVRERHDTIEDIVIHSQPSAPSEELLDEEAEAMMTVVPDGPPGVGISNRERPPTLDYTGIPVPDADEKALAEALSQEADAAMAPVEGPVDDAEDMKIVESAAMRRSRDLVVAEQEDLPLVAEIPLIPETPFIAPSIQLLNYDAPAGKTYDRDLLKENAQILENKLADYGVKGKVVEIHPGPVITMYEFRPAPGVKISKIANLSDDLAMALSALRIRIVAPIPGKDVVGIEVPNKTREIVWLKEILSDHVYSNAKSHLTLALGKDIVGNPTAMDLAKAPHLLVAGATGAGKSVAINTFICSILYSATPRDVRLIMIDPKMIELSMYEGIPHLLLPVVTDPSHAATALRWAVREMERRYRTLADLGVRNLKNYNAKVASLIEDPDQQLPERLRLARTKRAAAGNIDPEGVVLDGEGKPLEEMPSIVVIVDEFADLMMVAAKDVELCVARLAQKARAAGIHLILATQRPSVDVITGMIKANFPTRIAFRVASRVDSRTILDQKGADALLGMGDMLYLPPGSSAVQRVHGAFVSEEEVHAVVGHLKEQGQPEYDLGILVSDDEDANGPGSSRSGEACDELYDEALRIVADTRNASISFLQRKLKIGYNRAARIVEQLEEEGIIGPSDGTSRPREVFIDPI